MRTTKLKHSGNSAASESSDVSEVRFQEILSVLKRHSIARGITPIKLRKILEDLGPTYVKLGQIMSMRSDMFPNAYCNELAKLRTEVKPLSFETVSHILEAELKCPIPSVFTEIKETPLGSASIAQVHFAKLHDGTKVVIKVQRPGIREMMSEDIRLIKKASKLIKAALDFENLIDFNTVLDELWKTSQEEMDFIKEAANLDLFYENQKDIVYITSPKVFHSLTTPKMLVMNYVEGIPIDHVDELKVQGYDITEICQKTAENYCKQILEDGFFHADPHPGNLRIAGGQIAWLDLGMTGHLTEHTKILLQKAIHALLQNDIYTLKNVLLCFGEPRKRINHTHLYSDVNALVNKYITMDFGSINLGKLIQEALDLIKQHHIAVNADITLLGRSMITIEGTLSSCSPDVNLMQILSSHMSSLLFRKMDAKKMALHGGQLIYASIKKSLEIPALLSDLLHITKNGQAKLNLEFFDSEETLKGFRSSLDSLVLAILAGFLFLGSSFLCITDISPKIKEIPWIGFIGFLLAGILIFIVLLRVLFQKKKK